VAFLLVPHRFAFLLRPRKGLQQIWIPTGHDCVLFYERSEKEQVAFRALSMRIHQEVSVPVACVCHETLHFCRLLIFFHALPKMALQQILISIARFCHVIPQCRVS
jgi:hypothetical protein